MLLRNPHVSGNQQPLFYADLIHDSPNIDDAFLFFHHQPPGPMWNAFSSRVTKASFLVSLVSDAQSVLFLLHTHHSYTRCCWVSSLSHWVGSSLIQELCLAHALNFADDMLFLIPNRSKATHKSQCKITHLQISVRCNVFSDSL